MQKRSTTAAGVEHRRAYDHDTLCFVILIFNIPATAANNFALVSCLKLFDLTSSTFSRSARWTLDEFLFGQLRVLSEAMCYNFNLCEFIA